MNWIVGLALVVLAVAVGGPLGLGAGVLAAVVITGAIIGDGCPRCDR